MLIGLSALILIKTLAVYSLSVTKSFAIWNCLLLSRIVPHCLG